MDDTDEIAHERWIKLQLTSFVFYYSSLCDECVCAYGLSGYSGIINDDFFASQSNWNRLMYTCSVADLNIISFDIRFIFLFFVFYEYFCINAKKYFEE